MVANTGRIMSLVKKNTDAKNLEFMIVEGGVKPIWNLTSLLKLG